MLGFGLVLATGVCSKMLETEIFSKLLAALATGVCSKMFEAFAMLAA